MRAEDELKAQLRRMQTDIEHLRHRLDQNDRIEMGLIDKLEKLERDFLIIAAGLAFWIIVFIIVFPW